MAAEILPLILEAKLSRLLATWDVMLVPRLCGRIRYACTTPGRVSRQVRLQSINLDLVESDVDGALILECVYIPSIRNLSLSGYPEQFAEILRFVAGLSLHPNWDVHHVAIQYNSSQIDEPEVSEHMSVSGLNALCHCVDVLTRSSLRRLQLILDGDVGNQTLRRLATSLGKANVGLDEIALYFQGAGLVLNALIDQGWTFRGSGIISRLGSAFARGNQEEGFTQIFSNEAPQHPLRRRRQTGLHVGRARALFDQFYGALRQSNLREAARLRNHVRTNLDLSMFFTIQETVCCRHRVGLERSLQILEGLDQKLVSSRSDFVFAEALLVRIRSAMVGIMANLCFHALTNGDRAMSVALAKRAFSCISDALQIIQLIQVDEFIEGRFCGSFALCIAFSVPHCRQLGFVRTAMPHLNEGRQHRALADKAEEIGARAAALFSNIGLHDQHIQQALGENALRDGRALWEVLLRP